MMNSQCYVSQVASQILRSEYPSCPQQATIVGLDLVYHQQQQDNPLAAHLVHSTGQCSSLISAREGM